MDFFSFPSLISLAYSDVQVQIPLDSRGDLFLSKHINDKCNRRKTNKETNSANKESSNISDICRSSILKYKQSLSLSLSLSHTHTHTHMYTNTHTHERAW